PPDLPSFPTRRSSDLLARVHVPLDRGLAGVVPLGVDGGAERRPAVVGAGRHEDGLEQAALEPQPVPVAVEAAATGDLQWQAFSRSEEHTSELQSPCNL